MVVPREDADLRRVHPVERDPEAAEHLLEDAREPTAGQPDPDRYEPNSYEPDCTGAKIVCPSTVTGRNPIVRSVSSVYDTASKPAASDVSIVAARM